KLEGFMAGDHEVLALRASLNGIPLEVPSHALLFLAQELPSVRGGPADPATWDRWFGEPEAPAASEAEALARQRKAAARAPELAKLDLEVRRLREEGAATPARLSELAARARDFFEDWLLAQEVEELSRVIPAEREACSPA